MTATTIERPLPEVEEPLPKLSPETEEMLRQLFGGSHHPCAVCGEPATHTCDGMFILDNECEIGICDAHTHRKDGFCQTYINYCPLCFQEAQKWA